ncbi:MAG TPA: hypothetical protein VLB74_01915 [Flavobacterium sp.]|uniref:hypothetical protein n=1 Tax=Flavobacterium sp. TaxID=239 RepID=UPI002C7168CD|nr:hypothetical protein [Flavobacterium sp.]HSD13385.1 hypothetical protein [Flavobacterium sp.]
MKIKDYFFSFLICYFFFQIFEFLFSYAFEPLVNFVGDTIFNIDYTFTKDGYGSGDNTFSYLETFCMLCTSILLAFPIAYFIKKKEIGNTVKHYFIVLLRVYLAFYMLVYGLSKILPMQFPPLTLHRLSESYGESSPMGLAWTFMQYSPYYTAFTGFAEVLGGLLLLNRKTITLGTIILTGVLANVVMMNFCYDIPVKLFSAHMLIACLILLSTDGKRIYDFFILNKTTEPKQFHPISTNTKKAKTFSIVTISLKVVFVIGISLLFGFQYYEMAGSDNKVPSIYGIYEVIPSKESTKTYKTFIFDKYDMATIRFSDENKISYNSSIDKTKKIISLKPWDKTKHKEEQFTYTEMKNTLLLHTKDSVKIYLKKKSKEDLLLINRGFHWINERPFNR